MKKLLLIAALIIAPALYFFLGYYDVSATKPHSEIVNMTLDRIAREFNPKKRPKR